MTSDGGLKYDTSEIAPLKTIEHSAVWTWGINGRLGRSDFDRGFTATGSQFFPVIEMVYI